MRSESRLNAGRTTAAVLLSAASALALGACSASLGSPCTNCSAGGDPARVSDSATGNTDDAGGAGDPIAPAGDPSTPGDGGLVTAVTKDGITWTFAAPTRVGQFVTGDYYVVGPVTVTAVSPVPETTDPYRNGSVLNMPNTGRKSGFDRRLNDGSDQSGWFDASLRVYPPIDLSPGDALVSSVSLSDTDYHNVHELFGSGPDMSCSPVKSVSILSVLSAATAPDAFRPSYCDRTQKLYFASDLNRSVLPSLAPPNTTIGNAMTGMLAQFEGAYRRPWTDLTPFNFDSPADYMPSYAAHIAFADSYAGLLLTLNFSADAKVNLTNYLVQYGIDLYGCANVGMTWKAFGGHGNGRKMPIIFAGLLFDNAGMKGIATSHPNTFGEDMHTVYISQIPGSYTQAWQGAAVIYGGHYGVDTQTGAPMDTSHGGLYAPYEQLQPAAWPLTADASPYPLGEAYRRCCTSTTWVGEALAIRLMGGKAVWNHDAFFDYVDRWMTEDDTTAVADILSQTGFDYSTDWERQRQTKQILIGRISQPSFIDDMWAAYR